MNKKTFFITGGAGFIGSNLLRALLKNKHNHVVNLDKLTYAGRKSNIEKLSENTNYAFVQGDICDENIVNKVLDDYKPDVVIHLAAESHVDRSIDSPRDFIQSNIVGTYVLLQAAYHYWCLLPQDKKSKWLFLHVSTDEVYGDLNLDENPFTETNRYVPSSPYSASKASADHLARAWHRTYGLPVIVTNCSNNYGPFQLPEKLIPLVISNCILGKRIPVYGDGKQIRDWIFVDDHIAALFAIAEKGKAGESYNIGGNSEMSNLDLIHTLCEVLNELKPVSHPDISDYKELIEFVNDRPGHDKRYAIDIGKIVKELDWKPKCKFHEGVRKTVQWYLDNDNWLELNKVNHESRDEH